MKSAMVVDANDLKKILAERFGVSEDKIIKNQYTFTIIIESEVKNNDENA